LARSSQSWICVSEANRAILADQFGIPRGRIAVVRNGVDHREVSADCREQTRVDLDVPPDATLVLTTGRLGEQKGHRVIVEALPRLVALDERLVFVWAGDGPLRPELARTVGSTGLEGHVRFLGRRDDVPDLLAAADLFLMPSRDEGAPLALVEAMLAGVPAIVSDAPALTETIADRRNGLVFTRDDPDDLVRVVGWALAHRDQLAQMAAQGRELALRELTLDRMLAQLLPYLIARGQSWSRG
jgi:glycosyltransferase involved in cell wall biosynthesis